MTRPKTCAHMLHTGPNGKHTLFRHDHEKVTVDTITPHRGGDPIGPNAELLRIEKDPSGRLSCETIWSPEEAAAASHGPAKVATPAYRSGWDAIWKAPDLEVN